MRSGFQRYCNVLLYGGLVLAAVGLLGRGTLPDVVAGLFTGLGSGFALGGLVFKLMPRWWKEELADDYDSSASQRYRRRLLPAMALYAALLIGSMWLIRHGGITSLSLRAVISVLPVIPLYFVFYAVIVYVREVDEFKRRIELESIAIGAMFVCLIYLPLSFLQMAKVIDLPSGDAMLFVFPVLCMGYAIGKFITMRRYR